MSQSEYTAMALKVAPNTALIGSNSNGTDGDITSFFLPDFIMPYMSGVGVYYPDGRQTQRIGITPDIVVKPTIKAIRDGKDELIEKAIQLINE